MNIGSGIGLRDMNLLCARRRVSLGVRFWGCTPGCFVKSEKVVWNVGDADGCFLRVNKTF